MNDLRTWAAWHIIHQPFELGWWKQSLAEGQYADDEAFAAHWAPVRDFIKPAGRVLDIGCGPRPPFVPCAIIDPLARAYREMVPASWWAEVSRWSCDPAEEAQEDWFGKFDTVICWNVLDHTIGWVEILDNMRAYGAPGARFAIATDFWPPFDGHPGFEREAFMHAIQERFSIIEEREPFGRHLALLLAAKG